MIFKNKLFKAGGLYSASSLTRSVAGMLTGLLMLRWLEPSEIGIWQAITIIQAYLPFFQLGVQSGLNRDLPVLLGKGEIEKGHQMVATAKSFAIFLSILFIVLTTITVIVLIFLKKQTTLILGIGTLGFMSACFSYQNHISVTFRSAQSFEKLAKVNFIFSVISVCLLFFIYQFHYYGILIFNILSSASLTLLTHFARPFKNVVPSFSMARFSILMKTGLIMMSFAQIRSMAMSIPKIIILYLKGPVLLGLYSPALAVNSMFALLPNAIAQFFHPQAGFKYGVTGNARDLWSQTRKLFWLLIIVSIPVSVLLWFLSPYLLEYVFPKYQESLLPMRIMIIAFIFSSAYTTHGVLYSIKAYKFGYIYSISEFIGFIVFPGIFVLTGHNILVDITLGLLCNNIFLSVLNYFLLRHVLFLKEYNLS